MSSRSTLGVKGRVDEEGVGSRTVRGGAGTGGLVGAPGHRRASSRVATSRVHMPVALSLGVYR